MNNIKAQLTEITKNIADIETLESRFSDELDFHDISVWTLEALLLAAYRAGQSSK